MNLKYYSKTKGLACCPLCAFLGLNEMHFDDCVFTFTTTGKELLFRICFGCIYGNKYKLKYSKNYVLFLEIFEKHFNIKVIDKN
jgi:hypothetical protein